MALDDGGPADRYSSDVRSSVIGGGDPRAAGSRPSALRQAAVWGLVRASLQEVTVAGRTPTVLDCGGGTGTLAVPLAQAGAEVTVLDISIDALATLNRRAQEAGVSSHVKAVQGDLEAPDPTGLSDAPEGGYDLVVAHGVLEALDSIDALAGAVSFLAASVRPGGLISILVANPVSTVLARVLSGEVGVALQELRVLAGAHDAGADAGQARQLRLGVAEVTAACVTAGLLVEQVHGVGVFTELIPGGEIDGLPYAAEVVGELESLGAQLPPFRDIAGRLRLLARRPA
ncbi:bifunctional 2-polyprenyl-6-hydroxyphenol methylase/3-demethylubiquinol 3-O-methyltransferase UbiG [Jatrophihabitans sp. GAS493]|uniref:class I SAM-dependent methyltransferase n=1 Tax=Jatrophihabitans sp. GAS493 TaxID=1907575 RepID=UPI0018D58A52|nr:class I SAM-dependent methyltransferase [Jatrophihabitans sp. GAS493]